MNNIRVMLYRFRENGVGSCERKHWKRKERKIRERTKKVEYILQGNFGITINNENTIIFEF